MYSSNDKKIEYVSRAEITFHFLIRNLSIDIDSKKKKKSNFLSFQFLFVIFKSTRSKKRKSSFLITIIRVIWNTWHICTVMQSPSYFVLSLSLSFFVSPYLSPSSFCVSLLNMFCFWLTFPNLLCFSSTLSICIYPAANLPVLHVFLFLCLFSMFPPHISITFLSSLQDEYNQPFQILFRTVLEASCVKKERKKRKRKKSCYVEPQNLVNNAICPLEKPSFILFFLFLLLYAKKTSDI